MKNTAGKSARGGGGGEAAFSRNETFWQTFSTIPHLSSQQPLCEFFDPSLKKKEAQKFRESQKLKKKHSHWIKLTNWREFLGNQTNLMSWTYCSSKTPS